MIKILSIYVFQWWLIKFYSGREPPINFITICDKHMNNEAEDMAQLRFIQWSVHKWQNPSWKVGERDFSMKLWGLERFLWIWIDHVNWLCNTYTTRNSKRKNHNHPILRFIIKSFIYKYKQLKYRSIDGMSVHD